MRCPFAFLLELLAEKHLALLYSGDRKHSGFSMSFPLRKSSSLPTYCQCILQKTCHLLFPAGRFYLYSHSGCMLLHGACHIGRKKHNDCFRVGLALEERCTMNLRFAFL